MSRRLKIALTTIACTTIIDHAAQAFPFQLMQQGSLIESQRDVRQLLPARKANLIGYWRFEGGYQDASGGGNTGIAGGSATIVTGGAFGQAVSLNGSTDYISFASSILPSATNVTISVWFNQDALASGKSFYDWGPKSGCNPSGQSFGSDNSGHIQALVGCGGTVTSATTFTVSTWNHAVMTKDGSSNVRLYLNGTLVAGPSNNNGGQTLASGNDLIGANWNGGAAAGYFNGKIDEVAVWNTVLSPAEVATLYQKAPYVATVLADNPAAYWRFEESSGSSAYDSSGNGNTATYISAPTLQTAGPLAQGGYGITLDSASSQYVQTSYLQNAVTAYSVEIWIKTTTTAGGMMIVDRGSGAGKSLTLKHWNGTTVLFELDSNGTAIGAYGNPVSGQLNNGNWHHIVGTWAAPNGTPVAPSQFKVYIDGVPINLLDYGSAGSTTSPLTGLEGTTIAHHLTSGYNNTYFDGTIDEVALYTTQLSAAQVAAHYKAAGANGHCTAGTGYTAMVIAGKCRWTFNQSVGSFSWTAPVAGVHIFAVGGGGGGDGAGSEAFCYNGGGGGGYYTHGNYTLTAGTSYTVVVGAGGAGGGSSGKSLGSTGGSSGVTGVVTVNGGVGGGTNGNIRNGGAGGSGGGCGAYNGGTGAGGAGGSNGFCNNGSVIAGAGSGVTPYIAGYGSGGGGGGDSGLAGHTGQPGGANAGAGGDLNGSGGSATAFYGGGGGGAGCAGTTGGGGGSGVVIIEEL